MIKLTDLELKILKECQECLDLNVDGGIIVIKDENYVEEDTLFGVLQEFISEIRRKEEEIERFSNQETKEEHIINESFDRGFHPHEYL